ncbi:MAG: hypothetical protein CFE44_01900, partial [Burkholderiales bacterium PBB4]
MATISSLGIGSGLDSESIVTKLVALEKQPLKALEAKATFEQNKISAFGQIQSQFSSLADVATRIASVSAWSARTATSSNTAAATISSTSTAPATSFTLDVDALATSQSSSSAAFATGSTLGQGVLTFRLGKWSGGTGNAGTDNAAVNAADLALPAAQAALSVAQADLVVKNAALATADAELAAATLVSDPANLALDAANADLVAASNTNNAALATLGLADAALTSATSVFNAADADFNAKDLAWSIADAAATAANANSVTKSSDAATALNAFTVSRDKDVDAATRLADFVNTDPDGPKAAAYSNAYTAWVSAIAANDHASPTLQAAEDSAFSNLKIARGALALSYPAVKTAADNLTITLAGSDPEQTSLLKGASVSANADASIATNAASAAVAAAAAALSAKSVANLSLVSATNARDSASGDRLTAAADAAAAAAAKAAAEAAQSLAASVAAAANGVTAAKTAAQSLAATNVATANQEVLNATTAVSNATNGTVAARPTFTAAPGSADVSVTILATDKLSAIAAKINAANAGVVATVFKDGANERLQLVSKDTGADAGFRIQVSDTGDSVDTDNAGLSRLAYDPQTSSFGMASSGIPARYGQDAKARINGLAVTSKTNTLADNFPGVTINLLSTTTQGYGTPAEVRTSVSMGVREDVTGAVRNVQDFVTAYNTL